MNRILVKIDVDTVSRKGCVLRGKAEANELDWVEIISKVRIHPIIHVAVLNGAFKSHDVIGNLLRPNEYD